jgi:hypothetical protein
MPGSLVIMVFSLSCASSTCLNHDLTLNKTAPRSMAFSLFIIGGPSLIFISATASKGIGPNSWFVPAVFLGLQYYFTLVHIWHLRKTLCSFNGSDQCHSDCRFSNIIHISMLLPYLQCLPICFNIDILPPVIGSSVQIKLSSSVPWRLLIFVPKLRWYLNLPHKFYAHVCSNSLEDIFIQ